MSDTSSKQVACPSCGTKNPPTRTLCFICYEPLSRSTLHRNRPAEPIFDEPDADSTKTLVALMIAVGVVCFGVIVLMPGLGILMSIVLVIPFIRTIKLVHRRAGEGRKTSTAASVGLFFMSTLISGIVLSVVCSVAFGTFCLTCLGSSMATQNDKSAVVIASGATVVALCVLGYFIFRFVRWRWYQDIDK